MKYCPQCGSEFIDSVDKCIDCGVGLTDTKPALPEPEFVDWVAILEHRDFGRIGLAESLLQAAGIDYIVEGVGSQMAYAVDPMRVCVKPEDVERAKSALEELVEGEEE